MTEPQNTLLDQFLKSIFILISLKVIYTLSLHWPLRLHFLLTPRSIKSLLCDYLQELWLLATSCSEACLCCRLFLSHHSLTKNLLVLKWITDFWWASLFAPAAHAQESFTGFCRFKLFFIEIVNQYLPEIMVWSLKGDLVSLLQCSVTKRYTHQLSSRPCFCKYTVCSASCFSHNEVSILGQSTRCNNYFHRQSSMSSLPLASMVLNIV